jgi:3-hydroxyisobutyrate dehydrogenase-like beta-hydroxyacid dehydrogenase
VLLLSGADANAAAELFAPAMAVKVVGGAIGQASAVKMAMALMTKALVALFVELSCAAGKAGCLEATLEMMRRLYPGTLDFLERTLPTYPVHLTRRIGEMREAQSWLAALGQAGAMTRAATGTLERIEAVLPSQSEAFAPLLERIVALDPLGGHEGAAGNLALLPMTRRFIARRARGRARRRLV